MEPRVEDTSVLEHKLKIGQECVQPLDNSVHLDCLLSETSTELKVAFLRIDPGAAGL